MMPPGGGAARGDQLAVLAGMSHSLLVAPVVGDDLAEAEATGETDPWRAANLRLMRHAYTRATAMPPDLVEAQARANSACEKVWREARRQSDFAMVRPHLEEVVRLMREAAAALAPALGLEPVRRADGWLPAGHAHRRRRPGVRRVPDVPSTMPCPRQRSARHAIHRRCGRRIPSPSRCRRRCAAVSPSASGWISPMHGWIVPRIRSPAARRPMCASPSRYDEADFTQAVLAVVHETGHALYERGLPAAWARQPVGEAAGMAAHESQSLIVEMQACRSDALPELAGSGAARSVRRRCRAVSAGQPGAAVATRRARLHPRRCRRDDLSGACHPALPAGAGAGRGRR